ncbi:MAG: RNA polymerase sigma factor [Thermoanaerobaculia bacterium]
MDERISYDLALIARLVEGDEPAFDELIDEYYPRLYRFAHRRTGGDSHATQEVVQASFAAAIPKLGEFRGEASLFSWLCTVCRYEINAYWRRTSRQRQYERLIDDSVEVRAAFDSLERLGEDPESQLVRKRLAEAVRVTLDALPVRYGNALEWKYLQGLTVADVAARLGTSVKAAESTLTRAREAFRDGFSELLRKADS